MPMSTLLPGLLTVGLVVLFLSALAVAGDRQTGPVLGIAGDRFLLDGQETELWGIRVASGTHTQQQCEHLIDQLDAYKAHGVNAVTVFYMGCRGANYDPFGPDGRSIDPGHQERMERIIQACAERNIVVVVGIFYQAAPIRLKDAEAVRSAVRLVTEKTKPYRNVIINVCNEHNSGGWEEYAKVFDFRDPERIVDLCRLVHEVDPRRIVGGGGYDHDRNIAIGKARDVDVLLFDTAGFEPHTGELYRRFVEAGVRGKPIVNVETFGGVTGKHPRGVFSDELKKHYFREVDGAAAAPGLSVFFHNNPWCQSQDQPMRYDLGGRGTEADPGIRWYFEYVRSKAVDANRAAAAPHRRAHAEEGGAFRRPDQSPGAAGAGSDLAARRSLEKVRAMEIGKPNVDRRTSSGGEIPPRRTRVTVEVSAEGQERHDKPVEAHLDIGEILKVAGPVGAIEPVVTAVNEVDGDGNVLDAAVEFQFDADQAPSAGGKTLIRSAGTLTFLLAGKTGATATRRFEVLLGGSASRGPASRATTGVAVTDGVEDEGQQCYKVVTPAATYFYQKQGAAFSSILDRDGNDWVGHHPTGGSAGAYRGIPNFADEIFHPGGKGSSSRLLTAGPLKAAIESQSLDGQWACRWDIFPRYATMTLTRAPVGAAYWFLYEGTPGGKLDERNQYCLRSDGARTPASQRWEAVLKEPEWVAFGSPATKRMIFLVHHERDDKTDSYWPMQQSMTVFGFGRDLGRNLQKHMKAVPARFTIGLADEGPFDRVAQVIGSAWRDVKVTVGKAQECP